MFENLIKAINEGKTQEALQALNEVKGKYEGLVSEVQTKEIKLTDAINERNKVKGVVKIFKEKLGINDGEELSEENITSKVNNLVQNKSIEVSELEKTIETLKQEKQNALKEMENKLIEKDLDYTIGQVASSIKDKVINEEALGYVLSDLRKGATIEDGKVVYKNEDGSIARKDGMPLSVEDRISEIQDSKSFFFKANVESGSGEIVSNDNNVNSGGNDFTSNFLA